MFFSLLYYRHQKEIHRLLMSNHRSRFQNLYRKELIMKRLPSYIRVRLIAGALITLTIFIVTL